MTEPPSTLLDHRSEPEHRAILEDWLEERGRNLRWLGAMATSPADDAADAADADAAADAADDAADDDADAADDRQITKAFNRTYRGETEMREGLKILVTPGNYWALTQIGWLRRVTGDEWELVGARVLRRIGDRVPLAELAAKGPGKTIRVETAAEVPEEVHRLTIRRCIPASEKAWGEHCPRPMGWVESE